MKVVFDTNVIVSAIGWEGPSAKVFFTCLDVDKFTIITSEPLLKELYKVLDYPKFKNLISDEQKYAIFTSLAKVAQVTNPKEEINLIKNLIKEDPQDNRVLECALAGDAGYIISGDNHLLKLGTFNKTKIISVEEFLKIIFR